MTDTRDKLAAVMREAVIDWNTRTTPKFGEDVSACLTDALLASDVLRDMLNEARREGAEAAWPEVRGWINEAEERGRAEVAATERERDRLREWKAEATQLFDGLQDLGRALDLPLGVLVTGPIAIKAANALREERDAALADRGALDRVRAEALREAARDMETFFGDDDAAYYCAQTYLRDRADRIERDGGA